MKARCGGAGARGESYHRSGPWYVNVPTSLCCVLFGDAWHWYMGLCHEMCVKAWNRYVPRCVLCDSRVLKYPHGLPGALTLTNMDRIEHIQTKVQVRFLCHSTNSANFIDSSSLFLVGTCPTHTQHRQREPARVESVKSADPRTRMRFDEMVDGNEAC